MIVRPRLADFKIIGLYTGKVIIGVGLLMVIPLGTSFLFGEWNPVLDFLFSMGACLVFGLGLGVLCQTSRDLAWGHGLVVVSFSWFMATVLGAIPHYLSGHFSSYLDAMF